MDFVAGTYVYDSCYHYTIPILELPIFLLFFGCGTSIKYNGLECNIYLCISIALLKLIMIMQKILRYVQSSRVGLHALCILSWKVRRPQGSTIQVCLPLMSTVTKF